MNQKQRKKTNGKNLNHRFGIKGIYKLILSFLIKYVCKYGQMFVDIATK